jgi:hypothetical protein
MASATAAVTLTEVEVGSVTTTHQQIEGRNQEHSLQAISELTPETLRDEDEDDDDYDDDAIFSDICNFGGVGP